MSRLVLNLTPGDQQVHMIAPQVQKVHTLRVSYLECRVRLSAEDHVYYFVPNPSYPISLQISTSVIPPTWGVVSTVASTLLGASTVNVQEASLWSQTALAAEVSSSSMYVNVQSHQLLVSFTHAALQCPTLTAPRNGTISCTSQMTGGSCSFDCDTGYTLRGSRTRFCRPSATWSGSPTFCDPLLCEPPLQPPENGIILPPCRQEYTSSCIIDCVHGYKINGTTPSRQMCVLNEMEEAVWTEPPVCIGKCHAVNYYQVCSEVGLGIG